MKTEQVFAGIGALLAALSVAAGAFGAHILKSRLPPDALAIFETGARYQMYHALALFAVAWGYSRWPGRAIQVSGWCFVAGIVIFCGSLYALSANGPQFWGAVTPAGGVAFLVGWAMLLWGIRK